MKTTITALCNQKGGVGKSTSCVNLGIGLAQEGQKVLLVDCDPQGSMTISLGWSQPDRLTDTLSTAMLATMQDEPYDVTQAILHHSEGVDILPANIELSGVEVSMVNAMSRESILKQTLEPLRGRYDRILLDCMPSLGMLTVNALAAANSALIPVQAQYLSAKGLEQLLGTIAKVRRQLNPKLSIDGVLLTMWRYSRAVKRRFFCFGLRRWALSSCWKRRVKGWKGDCRMMRDKRTAGMYDDQSCIEQGFPSWLQKEVDTMKRSWEIEDSGKRDMRWDTIWCELNADVNYAEIEGIITKKQADYLRKEVLRMGQR